MTRQQGPTKCRGCGMTIEFIKNPNGNGKWLPLQRVRSAYVLEESGHRKVTLAPTTKAIFVSHFETCPSADEFTRKRDE